MHGQGRAHRGGALSWDLFHQSLICVAFSRVQDLNRLRCFEALTPRLRTYSQNRTVATRAMAAKKTVGHLSYRMATRRQSLSLPNMISIRLRRL